MAEYFKRAMNFPGCVRGLNNIDCVVVKMFTDDNSSSAFYREYNVACAKKTWEPYKVYSTLLLSALKKLSVIKPLPQDVTLYRGLDVKLEPLKHKRVFFKGFSSVSLKSEVAESFAKENGTILKFHLTDASCAAKVGELSGYGEAEAILLPFVAFDILASNDREISFKTSSVQELLRDVDDRSTPQLVIVNDVMDKSFDSVIIIRENAEHLPVELQCIQDSVKAAIENATGNEAVVMSCSSLPSGNIIVVPMGTVKRDYADVGPFQDAVMRGFKKALSIGCQAPLLIGLSHSQNPLASDVTLLGSLHALYMQEKSAGRASKVTRLGLLLEADSPGHTNILAALETKPIWCPDIAAEQSIKFDSSSGLHGLDNPGYQCFRNSILQCLANTKLLVEFCCSGDYDAEINHVTSRMKGALIKAYADLMKRMWSHGSSVHSISSALSSDVLTSHMPDYSSQFDPTREHDAHEFLVYLLRALHEDINRIQEIKKCMDSSSDDIETISATEKARLSWESHLNCNDSKVFDIFTGQQKSSLTCKTCGYVSNNFQPFLALSVPLEQAGSRMSLYDCFNLFSHQETLTGVNKPNCAKCKTCRTSTKQLLIERFPKVLVVQLNRFQHGTSFKLGTQVDCPVVGLDLSPFKTASSSSVCKYDLYAVCNHTGSTTSGHYRALVKHPFSAQWHVFSDKSRKGTSMTTLNSSEAYLLFYELQNSNVPS